MKGEFLTEEGASGSLFSRPYQREEARRGKGTSIYQKQFFESRGITFCVVEGGEKAQKERGTKGQSTPGLMAARGKRGGIDQWGKKALRHIDLGMRMRKEKRTGKGTRRETLVPCQQARTRIREKRDEKQRKALKKKMDRLLQGETTTQNVILRQPVVGGGRTSTGSKERTGGMGRKKPSPKGKYQLRQCRL